MSDNFEGIPLDLPADVPAETQPDGAVTEDYTGEQVANEGGNSAWYNSTYPGQTQNTPTPAVDESAAETARLAQQNQQATGTPVDVSSTTASLPTTVTNVGGAVTTSPATPTQDAYGLNILNAQQTAQLTRNINPKFINSLVDPNTPIPAGNTNAVNTSASKIPVLVDANGVVFDPVTGVSFPVDSAGKQIIPADVAAAIDPAAQERINNFNQLPTGLAKQVDPTTLEGYGVNEVGATPNPTTSATAIDTNANDGSIGNIYPDGFGGFVNGNGQPVDANGVLLPTGTPTLTAKSISPGDTGFTAAAGAGTAPFFGANPDAEQEAAAAAQVGRQLAQQQAVLAAQKRVVNNSDWRVRLQLAPGAQYLYNAPQPGILWPLRQTDGVIFPYTPKIQLNYKADYEATPLMHSNYKGYFYKSSSAEPISLNAMFTAQDTSEAEYLLAVIHFFRSATKMFYGQDPNRGAPPPLVYLTGLGEYQFTQHPCVIANFNYNLPSDVDYIRARSINVNGTDLTTRRDKQSLPTNPISGAVARLQNLFSSQGINKGALFFPPPVPNLGQNQPTYVPTKMEIDLTLYPMQSRQQVSRVFDNRQYNNGAQLKGGFW